MAKGPKKYEGPFGAEQIADIRLIRDAGYRSDCCAPNLPPSHCLNVFSDNVGMLDDGCFYWLDDPSAAAVTSSAREFFRFNPVTGETELALTEDELLALKPHELSDGHCPNLRGPDGKVESHPYNLVSKMYHPIHGTAWQPQSAPDPLLTPPVPPAPVPEWAQTLPTTLAELAIPKDENESYRRKVLARIADIDAAHAETHLLLVEDRQLTFAEVIEANRDYTRLINPGLASPLTTEQRRAVIIRKVAAQYDYELASDLVRKSSLTHEQKRNRYLSLLRQTAPECIAEAHAKLTTEFDERRTGGLIGISPARISWAMRQVFALAEVAEGEADALEEIERIRTEMRKSTPRTPEAPKPSFAQLMEQTGLGQEDLACRLNLDAIVRDLLPKLGLPVREELVA